MECGQGLGSNPSWLSGSLYLPILPWPGPVRALGLWPLRGEVQGRGGRAGKGGCCGPGQKKPLWETGDGWSQEQELNRDEPWSSFSPS